MSEGNRMRSTLRAGIAGTGFMGRVHAEAVRAAGHVVAGFVGTSVTSAGELAHFFPGSAATDSLNHLLEQGVDVVHVCTPNALHPEFAFHAIEAGIPVICEKPLATSVDEAATLAIAAAERGLVTGVPFVYRFYPLVREIRRRIALEREDRLWMLHGSYLQDWLADPAVTNWRVEPERGGGSRAFGDIGVHWCDLMEFVTGQRIVRLSARTGNAFERLGGRAQNLTEDGGVVMFETDTGALGSLVVSQASAGRRNRLWFSFDGSRTSYSFDQETPEHAWIGGSEESIVLDRRPGLGGSLARTFELPAGHPQGYQHCFNDFVADVYAGVSGQVTEGRPDFVDGLRAAILTEAVIESAQQQRWVDVRSTEAVLGASSRARTIAQ